MAAGYSHFVPVLTGLGMVTPAGTGTYPTWERLCSAEGTAADVVAGLKGEPVSFGAAVPDFDPVRTIGRRKAWRLDRHNQLALAAAAEALTDSGLDPETWDGARVGVVLGVGLGGAATWEVQHRRQLEQGTGAVSPLLIPMLICNMSAGHLAIEYGARGPNLVTATACSSGTTAIGTARELLRSGVCDVVLTGGTESCVVPSIAGGFAQMGTLSRRDSEPAAASRPFDVDRDGFVLAEGAAILVMEREADARARGARVRAKVSGYGASADAHNPTAPDPQGIGAELAIRAALRDADLAPSAVDHVNAHGTSTPLNDAAEARLVSRVFPHGPPVTSSKGVLGHTLGAAGAIEAAAAALTLQHSFIPPTANLECQDPDIALDVVQKAGREGPVSAVVSNSFGFGGQNGVLLLTRA